MRSKDTEKMQKYYMKN